MAAILGGVSLKEAAQTAPFTAPALYVALERWISKRVLCMWLEEEKLGYEQ